MKILILQDDFPPRHVGGSGVVAHAQARELMRQGHEVVVVTAVRDAKDTGVEVVDGLTVHKIRSTYPIEWSSWVSLYNPQTIGPLKRILKEVAPDVVHAHNIHIHLSYAALTLVKRTGAKVFITLHDAMAFHYGKLVECVGKGSYRVTPWQQLRTYWRIYNPLRNFIIRRYLRQVDGRFAVSAALRDALHENGIKNVEVLYNGITVDEWHSTPEAVTAFIQKHHLVDKKVILFGGRLSRLKGGEKAVRMLAHVPDALLLVLGRENAYTEKMRALAASLGVEDRLRFTGWLEGDDRITAYHAADVVAVLSIYIDPLVLVNLEAMAAGKAVVGTCFGGTPEVVLDGTTGYIVNPLRTEEIADKVSALLADDALRTAFGRNGAVRAKEAFDLATITAALVRRYQA